VVSVTKLVTPEWLDNLQRATGLSRLVCEALLLGMTVANDEPPIFLWFRVQWRKLDRAKCRNV